MSHTQCQMQEQTTYFILHVNVSSSLHQFHNSISSTIPGSYRQCRVSILHGDNIMYVKPMWRIGQSLMKMSHSTRQDPLPSEDASRYKRKIDHPHFFQLRRRPPCRINVSALSTQWAVSNFENAMNIFISSLGDHQVPKTDLCKWLSVYVAEGKKQDGSQFSIQYLLLSVLLHHMHSNNPPLL